MKKIPLFLVLIAITMVGFAQIEILEKVKATGRKVLDQNNLTDKQAATILNDFVKKISGTSLPIVAISTKHHKGDIIIKSYDSNNYGSSFPKIQEDGLNLYGNGSSFFISGGLGLGTGYGVITLLEDYFDVQYFVANTCTYPQSRDMTLPVNLNRKVNPTFRYRQTQSYSILIDSLYKTWHRLEIPKEIFAANYWVHTFDRILPSKEFGVSHPEYYSFINGERRPGAASQWYLTIPEMFEIVATRIDSIFKANPNQKMMEK